MGREIKFRAWLKKLKKMVVVNDLTFNKHESDPVGVNDCGRIDCTTCLDWYELEDVELMQYTGLKDKNGVEIYEGDIVKFGCNDGFTYAEDEITIVKESEFHAGLVCKYNKSGIEMRIFNIEGYDYQVIGNIHENPELLKGGITC